MKKTLFFLSMLFLNAALMAQTWPNYPFTYFNDLCLPESRTQPGYVYLIAGEPQPCHTDVLTCAPHGTGPNGTSTNINDNIELNYNVQYSLNRKFNFTHSFIQTGAYSIKDNRNAAIDYFKNNDCNLFLATVNTQGIVSVPIGATPSYSSCVVTALKQDMTINWEASLQITYPANSSPCYILPQDIHINSQNEILVCGKIIESGSPFTSSDFAAKFLSTGSLVWIDYYITAVTSIQEDAANVIIDDENGHVIIAGQAEFIGSTTDEKPYIVAINSSTGALLSKSSLPFSGKYNDVISLGNDKYLAVGGGREMGQTENDMICDIWQLSSGALSLVKNNFIGQSSFSEHAYSVIQLNSNEVAVVAERSTLSGLPFSNRSSTLLSKLSINGLMSGISPVISAKHIIHNDMSTDPNISLVPVKLILPPSHPIKLQDHFSLVLNKYNTLASSFFWPTPNVTSTYTTNPLKASSFIVFELDNNLDEIAGGTLNQFEGTQLEPMDVCATNNYFENIAILSLSNTNNNEYNVFVRSPLDKRDLICDKTCAIANPAICSGSLYNRCIISTNISLSNSLPTLTASGGGSPPVFADNSSPSSPTTIIDKCSTLCNTNLYYVEAYKVINNTPIISRLADFENIIKDAHNNSENVTNKHLVISDVLGRITYNNYINNFEDLTNLVNNLPNGIYMIQLEVNGQLFKYKFLK